MTLKKLAIDSIRKGIWNFEAIGPRFRAALVRRIESSRALSPVSESASLLTVAQLAYSTEIPLDWVGFNEATGVLEPKAMNQTDFSILKRIVDNLYEGAEAIEFSIKDRELIAAAFDVIDTYATQTGDLRKRWISSLCKVGRAPFRSGSYPHAFGCIFLGDRIRELSGVQLAVSIVHEMAHQELFLLNVLDRLVSVEADYKLVHAPFQGTLRPTIGRLHSMYALFRMIEFQEKAGIETARHCELLKNTAKTFAIEDLTEFGSEVISAIISRMQAREAMGELNV